MISLKRIGRLMLWYAKTSLVVTAFLLAGLVFAQVVTERFDAALTSPTIGEGCQHRTNLGVLLGLDTGLLYRCDPDTDTWVRQDVQLDDLVSWGVRHDKRPGSYDIVGDKPIVTLTFDDGAKSQLENAWPLMKERNLPGTFCISELWYDTNNLPYCNSDCAGSECPENRITEAEAIEWFKDGADIQSHGSGELSFLSNTYNDIIADWSDHANWFYTNLGYYPETYCVPGGSWDLEGMIASSAVFQQVRSSTGGWNPLGGLIGNEYGGHRFFNSGHFSTSASDTGANMCEYIRNAVVPDDTAWLILGFHCFSAAGRPIITNEYPIDDFTVLLDCLQDMRDDGLIEVLTYGDAVKRRKRTRGRWNKLVNTGFGHTTGTTMQATQWQHADDWRPATECNNLSNTCPQMEFVANEDSWDVRQARWTQASTSQWALNQYVNGLVPGRSYIAAIDVEYEWWSTAAASHADIRIEMHSPSGGGDDPGLDQGSDIKSNLRRPTGESAGYRETIWVEFNAPEPFMRFRVWVIGTEQIDHNDECGGTCQHNGGTSTTVLSDSTANFHDVTGWRVYNKTDGSSCIITSYTSTTATCSGGLADGLNNDWEVDDEYYFISGSFVFRYPRIFETEVLGGGVPDLYSHKKEWPALVPFKINMDYNKVGDCCTDSGCGTSECTDCCTQNNECTAGSGYECYGPSGQHCAGCTQVNFTGNEYENVRVLGHSYPDTLNLWGEGPTAFLLTRIKVTTTSTNWDIRLYGCRSSAISEAGLCGGRGTMFFEKTGTSGSWDSETDNIGSHGNWLLFVKDEYGNNEFYDTGSGNAFYPMGNELHFEIDNAAASTSFDLQIEGFVLK